MDNRRATDPDVIDKMIAAEDDEQSRTILLILNNINKSLIANTETTRELSEKVDKHLTEYEEDLAAKAAVFNQGRGAWRVVAWVIGFVQVVGLGIWVDSRHEIEVIRTTIHAIEVKQEKTATECDALRRQFEGEK